MDGVMVTDEHESAAWRARNGYGKGEGGFLTGWTRALRREMLVLDRPQRTGYGRGHASREGHVLLGSVKKSSRRD
jgi:hypothetical protein